MLQCLQQASKQLECCISLRLLLLGPTRIDWSLLLKSGDQSLSWHDWWWLWSC